MGPPGPPGPPAKTDPLDRQALTALLGQQVLLALIPKDPLDLQDLLEDQDLRAL